MADSLVDLKSQMDSGSNDAPMTAQEGSNIEAAMNAEESDSDVLHATPNAEGKFFSPPENAPTLAGVGMSPPPPVRGDDLMDHATKLADFSDADKEKAKFIKGSIDLLIQKGKEDPTFGAKIAKDLSSVQGEDYAQKAVDEADKVKIDYLKKTDPDHFNSDSAAVSSFLNSASFGQLSRIYGATGALVMGQPYEDVVRQQAEKARLLQKEFPKSNFVGQLASYLIPGSPVKKLFETTAGLGAKGAASILGRIVSNPSLMAKAVGMSAGAGAAGAGSVGAVEGFAGSGMQTPFNLDRAAQKATVDGLGGMAIGALLPPVGVGIVKTAQAASPLLKAGARGAARTFGKIVNELSDTSPGALRAFNKNPGVLKNAANTESEIGQNIADFLLDQRKSKLPELVHADELLDQLPDVPAGRVVNYLRSFKKGTNKQLDSQVDLLHEWADRIDSRIPRDAKALKTARETIERKRALLSAQSEIRDRAAIERDRQESRLNFTGKKSGKTLEGAKKEIQAHQISEAKRLNDLEKQILAQVPGQEKIPAKLMREFVDDLQDAAQDQYGKESNMYVTALKIASRRAREEIINAAKGSGPHGEAYVKLMEKAAEKVTILKYVSRQLGRDPQVMAQRSQAFVDRIFGKNKDFLRARMADLDTKFGTNFLEKARNAQMAQEVGEGGVPSFFSNSKTGRSALGTHIGGAIGGVIGLVTHGLGGGAGGFIAGKAAGSVASSPRIGAKLIGMSDSMTGFAKRMVANPEAIARLAGIRMAKVPQGITEGLFRPANTANAAYDAANKGLAALRVPVEIQRLAQEIHKTLIKDGPKSAMSTIRVIADTPYFMGLVHFYDLAERRQQSKDTSKAISILKNQTGGSQ